MKTLIQMTALALLAPLAVGCEMDLQGEQGEVTFIDLTETPLDIFQERADGPVATQSTFRIRISEPGLGLSALSTSHESVLSLVETRPIYGTDEEAETVVATEVVTQVGEAGTARLRVNLGDGRTDYIDIKAVEPASSSITLFPNFGLMTFNVDMWSQGIALVQDGEFQLFGHALDDSENRLMGSGSLEWTASITGLTFVDYDEENDFIRVKSEGDLGMGEIQFGDSEPLEIETVSADAVASIRIMREELTANSVAVGDPIYLHVALYTEDGRLVVGNLGQSAEFTLAEGLRISETWANEDARDAHRAVFGDLLDDDRNTSIEATAPGQYIINARWGALEHSITIDVTPGSSDTHPGE